MYATISDLLKDLFGFYIPLPIQTFGFFMALSFGCAYWTTGSELKRKEAQGLLQPIRKKTTINRPVTRVDFITSCIIGAFIGFKALEMFLDYDALVANPQKFILSQQGSWFGAFLGALIAYYLKKKEADAIAGKKEEEITETVHPHQLMGNILIIAAVGGVLGAKLFHNLENIDEFITDPFGSIFSFNGLTFYGGLIVATVVILLYVRRYNIPSLIMCDSAAAGIMLAYGVGRIGCQLSGDGDWGINNLAPKPTWMSFLPDWVWAFRYPHNVLNEGIPIPGCEGSHCSMLEFPVYPTAFYEATLSIAFFFFLWAIRKQIKTPGIFFCVFLMLNGTERFFIEKIRINSTYHIFGKAITQAEIISFCLFAIGLLGIIYLNARKSKTKAFPETN